MDHLRALCCEIDEFCQACAPRYPRRLRQVGPRQRARPTTRALSEMLTLRVYGPWRPSWTFNPYSPASVAVPRRPSFPPRVGSPRFMALVPRALVPWGGSRATRRGRCPGLAFRDSTPLAVGAKQRRAAYTVCAAMAARGARPPWEDAPASHARGAATTRAHGWPGDGRPAMGTPASP
jgi:hypothetical protein